MRPTRQRYTSSTAKRLASLLALCALVVGLPARADQSASPADMAAALAALVGHPSIVPDGMDQVVLAPWPHAPAGAGAVWVIAALLAAPNDDGAQELWTGVLKRSDRGFDLIARDARGKLDDFGFPVWHPSLQLDLIPYRIAADDIAFGVRVLDNYNSTAHADNYGAIRLYHMSGRSLVPIFDALTSLSIYDKDAVAQCVEALNHGKKEPTGEEQSRCDADGTTSADYVLAFSHDMTRRHFDLLVRTRAAKGKPARLVKRAIWNGTTYQPRVFDSE